MANKAASGKKKRQAKSSRPSIRVLIVEDIEDDAALLVRHLEKEFDLSHKRVATGKEMKKALSEEAWDAVICDYTLPKFDFKKALEMTRAHDPDMPFLVVTGTITSERALELMRAGASEFITKDSLDRLIPALEREIRDANHRRKRIRAERSLKMTLDIARELSKTTDIESALLVTLERLCKTTGWDYGECWLCDKENNEITLMPGWVGDRKVFKRFREASEKMVLKYGEAIPGQVAKSGKSTWIEDVYASSLSKFLRAGLACETGFDSAFAVPVKRHNGDVFAIFYFFYRGKRKKEQGLVNLVESLAMQIGTFLETRLKDYEIREKSRLMTTVLENMDQAILVFNKDLEVIEHNRKVLELLDIDPGEFRKLKTFDDLGEYFTRHGHFGTEGSDTRALSKEHSARARSGQNSRFQRLTPAGRILEVRSRPMPGGGIIITYTDITQLKKTEQELSHMQRLESIGNLTGGIAHDFNNLLMVMTGNLDLLEEEIADNQEALEAVHTALRAAEKGEALTRQMLAFSRQQPLDPKAIDISENITDMITMLNRLIGEDVELDWQPADTPCIAKIDPVQMESALLNLVVNAKQAMPDGGKITITVEAIDLNESYIETHQNMKPGKYVRLSVTDEGEGMPPDVQERVFDPYFTTKSSGSGLGLAMVYGFVKQSGGHIRVYSEAGTGTRFRIYLPCIDGLQRQQEGNSEAGSLPLRKGATVLVIEDNQNVRSTVVRQIKSLGLNVEEAENVKEGLEILEDRADTIDLVFSDVVMPGKMSGLDLYKTVHEKWPDIGIILTSGFPDKALEGEVKDMRPDILAKPYRKSELIKAFAEFIGDGDKNKGQAR